MKSLVHLRNQIKASVATAQETRQRRGQAQGLADSSQCINHHLGHHLDCIRTTGRSTQAIYGRDGHGPSLFRGSLVPLKERPP